MRARVGWRLCECVVQLHAACAVRCVLRNIKQNNSNKTTSTKQFTLGACYAQSHEAGRAAALLQVHTPLTLLPILCIVTLLLLQEGEEAVDRVPGQVVAVVTAMVVMLLTTMQGACAACRLRTWALRSAAEGMGGCMRRPG